MLKDESLKDLTNKQFCVLQQFAVLLVVALAFALATAVPEPVAQPGVVGAYGIGYAAPVLGARAIVYG